MMASNHHTHELDPGDEPLGGVALRNLDHNVTRVTVATIVMYVDGVAIFPWVIPAERDYRCYRTP
jgi:hypothetical protein